jgi:hypothetical protein
VPDVLVQFIPSRPDDAEAAEVAARLLAAVRELGYEPAPDPQPIEGRGSGLSWTLILRWVGDHGTDVATLGTFLVVFAEKVGAIFRSHRRQPPRYLELYGPDGETVISRVELPEDDEP